MVFIASKDRSRLVQGSPPGDLRLRVVGSARDGQIIELQAAKCAIGSAPGCTLRLRARGVRSVHCLILRGNQGTVARAWAPNTQINGQPFRDAMLEPGDRLSIGPVEFEVLPAKEGPPVGPTDAGRTVVLDRRPAANQGTSRLRRENSAGRARRRAKTRALVGEVRRLRAQLEEITAARSATPQDDPTQERQLKMETCRLENERWETALRDLQTELDSRQTQLTEQLAELDATRHSLVDDRRHWERELDSVRDELARQTELCHLAEAKLTAARVEFEQQSQHSVAESSTLRGLLAERDAELATARQSQVEVADELAAVERRAAELDQRAAQLDRQQAEWQQEQTSHQRAAAELAEAQAEFEAQRAEAWRELEEQRTSAAALETTHRQNLADHQSRLTQLAASEGELSQRQIAVNELESTLQAQRQDLESQQDRLAAERGKLTADRDELLAERERFGIERQSLASEQQALAAEQQSLATARQDLAAEQVRQQADFEQTREGLVAREAELAARETALAAQAAELQAAATEPKADTTAELTRELSARQGELEQQFEQFARQRQEWDAAHATRIEQVQRAEQELQASRQQFQSDCEARQRDFEERARQLEAEGERTSSKQTDQQNADAELAARERQILDQRQADLDRMAAELAEQQAAFELTRTKSSDRLDEESRQLQRERAELAADRQAFEAEQEEIRQQADRLARREAELESAENVEPPRSEIVHYTPPRAELETVRPNVSQTETTREPRVGEEDESIEQYMADLLNRMRGGPAVIAQPKPEPARPRVKQPMKPPVEPPVEPVQELPPTPEQPAGESVASAPLVEAPPRELTRRKSFEVPTHLNVLREIGITHARSAIETHGQQRSLRQAYGTLGTSIFCFVAALLVFYLSQTTSSYLTGMTILVVGIFWMGTSIWAVKKVVFSMRKTRSGLRSMVDEIEAEIALMEQERAAEAQVAEATDNDSATT